MTNNPWLSHLGFDPISPLLASGNAALEYFVRRDLLDEPVLPVNILWDLPDAHKILRKQLHNGSWPWSGENKHPAINHNLVETWRYFRYLVEQYGFTQVHPQAKPAAEYIFSCQTEEGDFRGILANQYATYYTGAILATLIQAGFEDDPRVERCFQWLLGMRQVDLGWSIPLITHKLNRATQYQLTTQYVDPVQPDRSKPFSHNCTGMILRAFALHYQYRHSEAALAAAGLLKSRFFQPDAYTSYHAASYWVRFEYPFWWNNLVSALDSLSLIGLTINDSQILGALSWFVEHQQENGLWKVTYAQPGRISRETIKDQTMKLWISLAICRIFKRFY
jgi:hypothetical protein